MKKYIEPRTSKGLFIGSGNLLVSSLRSDDNSLQMDINSSSVEGAADARGGSFWDDVD